MSPAVRSGSKPRTVTILRDRWSGEYRVPGPKGTEAQAYYTDCAVDAVGTGKLAWAPQAVTFKFKSVDEWPEHLTSR